MATLERLPEVDPLQACEELARDAVALDVREADEWEAGRIAGALHIPVGELALRQSEIPRDRPLIVVCRSGSRSSYVTEELLHAGYEAENLAGGMQGLESGRARPRATRRLGRLSWPGRARTPSATPGQTEPAAGTSGRQPTWAKVIDQTRCIGCHACTTACKSENEVPLSVTRTFVKYVDVGVFPDVRRAFQVTRCNQCADAPCVTACPTAAMYQRPDGIVDFDKRICIGCKACMAACPYDAIFINPEDHSAEKCNFCAHRLDVGLEPACVVVCPVEAILVGDLNDPGIEGRADVLQAGRRRGAQAREADTAEALLHGRPPGDARSAGGEASGGGPLHVERAARARWNRGSGHPGPAPPRPRRSSPTTSRTGCRGTGGSVSTPGRRESPPARILLPSSSLLGGAPRRGRARSGVSRRRPSPSASWRRPGAILIADLEHPLRFPLIFLRPQWRSWLVRGAVVITAFAARARPLPGVRRPRLDAPSGMARDRGRSARRGGRRLHRVPVRAGEGPGSLAEHVPPAPPARPGDARSAPP